MGGGTWTIQGLHTITILFGKNGSGKSRLLRAWRDKSPIDCHYVIPERGGDLTFHDGYPRLQMDPQERRNHSNNNFVHDYRSQIVSRVQSYFLARGSVRGEPAGNPEELENLFRTLFPDFELIIDGKLNPPYRLNRVGSKQHINGANELSSGEAQLVTLAIDLLTLGAMWELQGTASAKTMLIDEPDAHIHPDLQIRFADFLVSLTKRYAFQVIIGTHSTTLLAAIGQFAANSGVVYLDRTKTAFSVIPFNKAAKELTACLGGHALMGPLFGVPLLLVEGDDDFRNWSQVPRHHVINLAVIPTNGDEIMQYQKALERIFSALTEPSLKMSGFALLDGDKALPQPNPNSQQNHVAFIRLNCRESENLYLTDNVLADLGTNWEKAAAAIVARSNEFGEKSAMLAQANEWDRKTVDLKSVINQLTQIIDSKNVHWTMRIARVIGRSVPTGQIEEFLGSAVVNALWDIKQT